MRLQPKDEGMLVEHAVWGLGKVVEITPPYAVIYFSSLQGSSGGPVESSSAKRRNSTRLMSARILSWTG
jgi:hypothetical protein